MSQAPPRFEVPGGAPAASDPTMEGMPVRFGKYTLIRRLATGGMAEIFLALQKSVAGFEKLLVIKRILPSMNQDQAFIEMLLQEARIAATLSHPNIVQIFDVGQADGQFFIAMEHVHGEDLRSLVRQMKVKGVLDFPLEHALAIALGMCAGLSYAHDKRDLDGTPLNIVHRDISPQNVVVTFTGDVKLVDFGIAKSDNRGVEITKSGKLKGKVPYMSPEQAQGQVVDARSDVFSLGVMLFELTTGKRLFKGQSEYETLRLICEREYPRPGQVRPDYPPELEAIVMKALAKDRDERYQSAREMQADLEAFVRANQIPVSSLALNQWMQMLFEEKLASQKEALLQGKQLADIIEMQHRASLPDGTLELEAQRIGSTNSMPAAARTVTDVDAARPRRLNPLALLGAGAVAFGALAGVAAYALTRTPEGAASANAAQSAAPAPAKGSLTIESDPPGASIWIDGDLRVEKTPATIASLPSGVALDVKLTRDGYEHGKQQIALRGGETGKVRVELKKGSMIVELAITPESAQASVSLDGAMMSGTRIEGLTSGVSHRIVVSAPGFVDKTVTVTGAPMETKRLDIALERAAEPRRASHAALQGSANGGSGNAPAPSPGSGKLNVGASGGWCNVSVDGAARGATPVAGLELTAGPHEVTCTTPDGKTRQATVTVPPDGTTRYKFAL